ncbi:MAG: NADH:flavin oxidoreductase, partial [Deltaproteobacteria bacterium]|nr:NADH:flavin oxidoreductase [Deltaproteobacteria bacterium]
FGDAARRAKEYGFDSVQLHGAHGYLINQFLSPHTNLRSDDYGGTSGKRCRFLLEVYREIRSRVGPDYPVLIKLNSCDFLEGGLEAQHGLQAAILLDKEGIDAIEVSGGTSASGDEGPARIKIKKAEQEAYHLLLAAAIKKSVSCPVMVVGGFRSLGVMEKALNEHDIDYIALSRPLIREPDLPLRWHKGDTAPAKCISCNSCFKPGLEEGGIYCVIEKKEQEKKRK